jgi:hypothetical protein
VPRSRPDSFVDFRAIVLEDVPDDVLAMYRVYAEGATVAEVAERFGRSAKRVRSLFEDCGLAVRSAGSSRHRLPLPPSASEVRRAAEAGRARTEGERGSG